MLGFLMAMMADGFFKKSIISSAVLFIFTVEDCLLWFL